MITADAKNTALAIDNDFSVELRAKSIPYNELEFTNLLKQTDLGGIFTFKYKGKDVVLKCFTPALVHSDLIDQVNVFFKRELQIMHACNNSKYVVHLIGYSIKESSMCIMMDHIKKGSLAHVLSKENLDWNKRIQIAKDIALGMKDLFERKVIHKDIKTLNILIDENYHAMITDFGISLFQEDEKKHERWYFGTHPYISPERQSSSSWPAIVDGKQADIYSFGIVLLELAMGIESNLLKNNLPKLAASENCNSFIYAFLQTSPLFDSKKCPPEIKSLIIDCISPDPNARPTIEIILERLNALSKQNIFLPMPKHTAQQARIVTAANQKALLFSDEKELITLLKRNYWTKDLAILMNQISESTNVNDVNKFLIETIIKHHELFEKFFVLGTTKSGDAGTLSEDKTKLQNFISLINFKDNKKKISQHEMIKMVTKHWEALLKQKHNKQLELAESLLKLDDSKFTQEITTFDYFNLAGISNADFLLIFISQIGGYIHPVSKQVIERILESRELFSHIFQAYHTNKTVKDNLNDFRSQINELPHKLQFLPFADLAEKKWQTMLSNKNSPAELIYQSKIAKELLDAKDSDAAIMAEFGSYIFSFNLSFLLASLANKLNAGNCENGKNVIKKVINTPSLFMRIFYNEYNIDEEVIKFKSYLIDMPHADKLVQFADMAEEMMKNVGELLSQLSSETSQIDEEARSTLTYQLVVERLAQFVDKKSAAATKPITASTASFFNTHLADSKIADSQPKNMQLNLK